MTYLSAKHPQNLTTLIAHNPLRLLIIEHRHSIPPLILTLTLKIHLLQMREPLMALNRVGNHILAGNILTLGDEAPAALAEMPVNHRVRDDVLEALKLAGNERATGPWACVADEQVIAAFLGRILGTFVARDPVAEGGDLALEFACFVAEIDPVCDFGGGRLVWSVALFFNLP